MRPDPFYGHGGWTSNGRDWPRLAWFLAACLALVAFWVGVFVLLVEVV